MKIVYYALLELQFEYFGVFREHPVYIYMLHGKKPPVTEALRKKIGKTPIFFVPVRVKSRFG